MCTIAHETELVCGESHRDSKRKWQEKTAPPLDHRSTMHQCANGNERSSTISVKKIRN